MNVARHHAEWLSLVETSGPFLSLPVLLRVFPQGLDRRDPDRAARLREAYEDWLERGAKVPAVHHAWVRCVLRDLLEYSDDLLTEGQAIPPGLEATMATFGETLRPNLVLKHRDTDKKPVLLIGLYQPGQDLDKPVAGKLWKATTGTRMMELLHAADVPLGLVTNGEQWMLVSARRGETTGFASWYADLWMQEPLTLQAFHSLMHLRRFVGVAEADALPALFVESSKDQQEVTDQLGYQVRQAVEVLIQAFGRVDAESGRTLLTGVSEKTLYDSALTVMMRLVFLFSAEERGLLLLGSPLYDQNYAVSTLSELLRERADQHGEEVLERRHDAWCRLLSTFRAVHGGVEHEAMRLLAYGGSLFDPDRFPFLEGRVEGTSWQQMPATPLLIDNRVVLHLLEALQLLRVKVPGGGPSEARRLSFRALDIEQIGHVYEGLLDHTAKRAPEPVLGLAGSKDSEPEIALGRLEEIAEKGSVALVEFLQKETGRSDKTLMRLIQEPPPADQHSLLVACGQDERLASRVKPFAALLREDSFERLVVIPPGSVYVTSGSDRRSTGTHYTPRSLTEPIVKHTLEPLVYVGPAEGLPDTEWTLKAPKEILSLKVCDMTMGSGAFLVETCRYLAERLVEAWENAECAHPGSFVVTPDGELSTGVPTDRLIPVDPAERVAIARRYVGDRCLYGVDINPMAVEMAKLSLWLVTLQRDRPFTFINHAFKCGDSLLGVRSLTQIKNFSLRPGARQITFATANLNRQLEEASAKRRALEDLPSNDHGQIEHKDRLHAEAEVEMETLKALGDSLIALELRGLDGAIYEDHRRNAAAGAEAAMRDSPQTLRAYAREQLIGGRRTFHWPVEFPEVFARSGFDALVGNPPFVGGKKITGITGEDYRDWVVANIGSAKKGAADLSAYFFLRAHALTTRAGSHGMIATSAIADGDTERVGLRQIAESAGHIFRAYTSIPWPGKAGVVVAIVWWTQYGWNGANVLNDVPVPDISSHLTAIRENKEEPYSLRTSCCRSFAGTYVNGKGFILSEDDATRLLLDPRNGRVIRPYLNGDDINTQLRQATRRWVIDFGTMSRAEAAQYQDCFDILTRLVKPYRDTLTKQVHESDYWKFWDKRTDSYREIATFGRVLVAARASKYVQLTWVNNGQVFSDQVVVFVTESDGVFACLQSSLHSEWAWERCTGMWGAGIRYAPSKAVATFPLPQLRPELEDIGAKYYRLRASIEAARSESLTSVYNRFHNPAENAADVQGLRALHREMDHVVASAYGWTGVNCDHDFHKTRQGLRYTLSESGRRSVLERVLALNHQRHAEELNADLHKKKQRKSKTARGASSTHFDLLG